MSPTERACYMASCSSGPAQGKAIAAAATAFILAPGLLLLAGRRIVQVLV